MPELDDDRNPTLGRGRGIDRGPSAQEDPITNPNGVYSGPSRRVAATDGTFAPISNMPADMTDVGRLYRVRRASTIDLSELGPKAQKIAPRAKGKFD